ncbi:hypothetical protein MHYP_G00022890 [Metynnis hypsauchen]
MVSVAVISTVSLSGIKRRRERPGLVFASALLAAPGAQRGPCWKSSTPPSLPSGAEMATDFFPGFTQAMFTCSIPAC